MEEQKHAFDEQDRIVAVNEDTIKQEEDKKKDKNDK